MIPIQMNLDVFNYTVNNSNNQNNNFNILDYLSFNSLWCLFDSTPVNLTKRFYINKKTYEIKSFDVPSNSEKYITEEEILEFIQNKLDCEDWIGPHILEPEIYMDKKLLINNLIRYMNRKKPIKKVRFNT